MTTRNHRALFAGVALLALSASPTAFAHSAEKGSYKIDPVHSQALFTVGHLGVAQFTGRFDAIQGDIVVNGGNHKVTAEIDLASVNSGFADRDKHLRSPDFFNAVQFPKATFESTKVSLPAKGDGSMTGNFTLHGVTRPVTFKLKHVGAGKDPWGGYRSGYVATATVKRSDFDMKFMLGGISDDVELRLNIEAIKQ